MTTSETNEGQEETPLTHREIQHVNRHVFSSTYEERRTCAFCTMVYWFSFFFAFNVVAFTVPEKYLASLRDECDARTINHLVLAKIVDVSDCIVTYNLDTTHNCSFTFTGGCSAMEGNSVYLYRSDDGACDTREHIDYCSRSFVGYNITMVIISLVLLGGVLFNVNKYINGHY